MTPPPYLKPGDAIGIAAPARRIFPEELLPTLHILEKKGFKVVLPPHLFAEQNQYAGDERQRAEDFQYLLDHGSVKAILCARGGYGSARIIDRIDFSRWKARPPWICGYSDATVFHAHLHQLYGVATLHSTMPINVSEEEDPSMDSLLKALTGETLCYTIPPHPLNRKGRAEAPMIGGNLSVLYSLLGSPSDIDTRGKILFLEDLDEYLYHIDRMILNLKRNGKLEGLAGLVVGGLTGMRDNVVPFGKTAEEIVAEHVAAYSYPVCFHFPAGHLPVNQALRFGLPALLEVDDPVKLVNYP